MKALSIKQPWAWLIVNGYKDIENRSWPTAFRGRVYVHAGKAAYYACLVNGMALPDAQLDFEPWIKDRIPSDALRKWREEYNRTLGRHLGCIVGEVDIVDCVTESRSPWFEGPYGFVLANPVAYATPVPYRGRLGFFDVTLPPVGKES